jgi:hypothetical protein
MNEEWFSCTVKRHTSRKSRSAALIVRMLATAIALSAMNSTLLSVHLLTILQSRGVDVTAAVALWALVGPSQLGARTINFFIARYHHPIWTKAPTPTGRW